MRVSSKIYIETKTLVAHLGKTLIMVSVFPYYLLSLK